MWVVIIDRTVNPFEPRPVAVYGAFKSEETALAKAEEIRAALERAGVDRNVSVDPMYPGSTSLREAVEDAR